MYLKKKKKTKKKSSCQNLQGIICSMALFSKISGWSLYKIILHNSNAREKTLPSCYAILPKKKAKAHPIYLTLMILFVITVVTFCFASEPSISIVIIIISLFVRFFPCQKLQSCFRQPLLWMSLCCRTVYLPSSFPAPTL